jgi:aminopeptidase N
LDTLLLDLLSLQIDSVHQNGTPLIFQHSDETAYIILNQTMQPGDTSTISVFYHGSPVQDISGFGGFYWSGDYAFNIGVAFESQPHNYGRVWFPCFDNFVERSTFDFHITTSNDKMALCNGEFIDSTGNQNGTVTWYWKMEQEIPSYLVCMAVGKYVPAIDSLQSISGNLIPVQYGAAAADTTEMKNSFLHLPEAFQILENSFGAYQWNKVGYSAIPFNGGAMEHATNIGYPLFAVNGNTTFEHLMVHELSHSWFGNLVTCRTAEDMWINEGMAVYCERLFDEAVYGNEEYNLNIAANHESVLHYAHVLDGGYLPTSGIPLDVTYGYHVYQGGCDKAHTLRGYLGDSVFFSCMESFLEQNKFSDVSSADMRDHLTDCSGVDMSYFFENWIFNPGYAAFTVDEMNSMAMPFPEYTVEVSVRQKLNQAPEYFSNVPLEITLMSEEWNELTFPVIMSGECEQFTFQVPFQPVYAGIDLADKISDAITASSKVITQTGSHSLSDGKMTLSVTALPDSAFVRIEHYYVAPDGFKEVVPGLHISNYRYWKVDGIIPTGFSATATVFYNGSTSLSGGYLDNDLITTHEDSLVILYRPGPFADWMIEENVTQNIQTFTNDKKGFFVINNLQKGEYALGNVDFNIADDMPQAISDSCLVTAVADGDLLAGSVSIFPNPACSAITVAGRNLEYISIFNLHGKNVYEQSISPDMAQHEITIATLPSGLYLVQCGGRNFTSLKRIIVLK